jgi:hypothetical protein
MKAKNYIIIGGAIALFLLWQKNKTTKSSTSTIAEGETATTETSQATSTSSEPEQVFGMGLPSGMDLPILTAGTGVPTEVAVQQGGVVTTPTPAIVSVPALQIEESLALGGIKPIVKPLLLQTVPIKTNLLNIQPLGVKSEVKSSYITKL